MIRVILQPFINSEQQDDIEVRMTALPNIGEWVTVEGKTYMVHARGFEAVLPHIEHYGGNPSVSLRVQEVTLL